MNSVNSQNILRVGTRRSTLAKAQTYSVINQIVQANPQLKVELIEIVTSGDRILDTSLSSMPGKGVFVKEIEDKLLSGEIDLAVHSMKDLPTEFPEGLSIGAITERVDPRDVFVSRLKKNLEDMPKGAKIGTSSLRRQAQLLAVYPELQIADIRGNIDTRLQKSETSDYDGIILAAAGLQRMGWLDRVQQYLGCDVMIPAVGQGAVGIEIREDDQKTREIIRPLNHRLTEIAVKAERVFLDGMGGGCQTPMGAFCRVRNEDVVFQAFVADDDGKNFKKTRREGVLGDAVSLAEQIVRTFKDK